ncbi:unnamed protein product [Trichogramma brassicae]|uniref:C2H2-type domain-containing protein n=1 Tax=Trichogramma brassicae TaxID=86971 RepID=A0A6H5II43_9HYME|nr:unnamed protein product [Trichogramma brassicae]
MIRHQKTVHEVRKNFARQRCEKKFAKKCKKKFGLKSDLIRHQKTVHEGRRDFACDKCEKKFGHKPNLIKHQRTVHENRKDFACDKCEKKFGLKQHLLVHQQTVHEGRKDFACDKCEKKFTRKCNLHIHLKTVHEGCKDFACDICEKKFTEKKNLLVHLKIVHEGRKDYACDKCEKKFGLKSNLIKHQNIVHEGRKDFTCNKCEKEFGRKTDLFRHQNTVHEGRKNYACDTCEKKFGIKSNLEKHQRTVHEGRKDNECNKCEKKFGFQRSLIMHQKTVHEGCKNYACDICEKKFGVRSHLTVHQKTVHESRKDYSCDNCEKKFGQKSNLLSHQKTVHEGRKDYACDQCEKKFGQKSDLFKHKTVVHEGRKDYSCDMCEKKFGFRNALLVHQRTVHEDRRDYACDQCEKKFGQKSDLFKHKTVVHEGRKDYARHRPISLSNRRAIVAFARVSIKAVFISTSSKMLIEDDYDMTIKDSSTVVKSVVKASSELEGEDSIERKILDSCYVPVSVPGGYYGSSCKLLCVATERQSVNGATKRRAEKYLVKQLPATKMARRVFKHPMTFCKELYFYETLAPLYRQLAKIDFAPRYVWSRLSLPNHDATAPHNDALLVTRYLKDFKMVDRYKGASFEDAKIVVHALAWFHATGIAIRHKRPDVYQQIQENFGFPIHLEKSGGEARRENIESMIDEAFRNHPETMSRIEIEPGTAEWLKETQKDPSRLECCYPRAQRENEQGDELSCLCHNDLWANNVMIRQRSEVVVGNRDIDDHRARLFESTEISAKPRYNDVRFVDWQTYYVSSPLTELVFFIFVTLELPLDAKKIDDLLAIYRETLLRATLDHYKIDLSSHLEDAPFFERLRRDARDELYHVVKFVKVASLVENEDPFDRIMDRETIDRLRSIFKIYREKKWLREK